MKSVIIGIFYIFSSLAYSAEICVQVARTGTNTSPYQVKDTGFWNRSLIIPLNAQVEIVPSQLRDEDTVCLYGNSITSSGTYGKDIFAYGAVKR